MIFVISLFYFCFFCLFLNGETRETRIKEFLTQNEVKVVGLREGNWIRVLGDKITTEGTHLTRIFEKGKEPYCLYRDWETDRKSTRLNSSHRSLSRMPSSA